jgi:hypothetical protein
MSGISWKTDVGVNHVGAYQVSGRPFATGSVDCSTTTEITFPTIARWVVVINNANSAAKVGFSSIGVDSGTNYFDLGKRTAADNPAVSPRLELKVSSIFVSGSNDISVVAGLTNITTEKLSTSSGTNWSGSSGVG